MKENLKIVSAVVLAFFVSSTIVYFFVKDNQSQSNIPGIDTKLFYSSLDPKAHKVFLVGSSHVASLNSTIIQNIFTENKANYTIYNLGRSGDLPHDRYYTGELDHMISSKPDLVIWGLSFRDFENQQHYINNANSDQKVNDNSFTKLPDVQEYVRKNLSIENLVKDKLEIYVSPRIVTTVTLINTLGIHGVSDYAEARLPFAQVDINSIHVLSDKNTLKSQAEQATPFQGIMVNGSEEDSMKLTIEKLHASHIKIVLFSTPQSSEYLDTISDSDKKKFASILQELSTKYNVPVFNLQDQYANMNIWHDVNHVANFANQPNDDIAKIIMSEIDL